MAITVEDVLKALETWAPTYLAESWDNVGLQIGSLTQVVKRLAVALDLTPAVLSQAKSLQIDCLITHHPLLFNPLRKIELDNPWGNLIAEVIRAHIAVISAHTNLDAALNGVNDLLARKLGLVSWQPMGREDHIVRVGELSEAVSLQDFAHIVQRELKTQTLDVVGDLAGLVKRVAICGGAGGGFLEEVLGEWVDVLVTGECKYHQARLAEIYGLALIIAGHFETEVIIVPEMARFFREYFSKNSESPQIYTLEERSPYKRIFAT